MVLSGTVSYYLANDIDASDTINWNAGAGFSPLTGAIASVVDIDGKGFRIKDLYINRPDTNYIGFIGSTRSASMKVSNIFLENANIIGMMYTGGLFGRTNAVTSITGCGVSGNIRQASDHYCGGICGSNVGAISKSYSKANISKTLYAAGLGGIAGENFGVIADCCAMGKVTVDAWYYVSIGGLVGINSGTINKCYSNGLILPVQGSNSTITGFVGSNSGTITTSYWDTETSGYTTGAEPASDPPTGKTTAQMKQQATFAGWDFDRTWKIIEGKTYPRLRIGATKKRVTRS